MDENKDSTAQNLTSFPNQNNKHIDYVLFYEKEESPDSKKVVARQAFFAALKAEKFEIYDIEEKHDDKIMVFSLLHASNERLLEEAELTRHEMVLKNVNILAHNKKKVA